MGDPIGDRVASGDRKPHWGILVYIKIIPLLGHRSGRQSGPQLVTGALPILPRYCPQWRFGR